MARTLWTEGMGAGYPVAMPRDSETTELPGVLVSRLHTDRPHCNGRPLGGVAKLPTTSIG